VNNQYDIGVTCKGLNMATSNTQPKHIVRTACESCGVRQLCLPMSLDGKALSLMDELVKRSSPLKKGDYLFRTGDKFKSLYAIQYGSMKSYGLTVDGKEQVTGFHLTGEVLGMDAIDEDEHHCNAVALEKTEVCELPFTALETLQHEFPSLQKDLNKIMSREIRRDQHMLLMLGSTTVEQRMARFILNLYQRLQQRGAIDNTLNLSMTRQDIGNYMGVAFETVSRQLAHMQDEGILEIKNRNIKILDIDTLEAIAG